MKTLAFIVLTTCTLVIISHLSMMIIAHTSCVILVVYLRAGSRDLQKVLGRNATIACWRFEPIIVRICLLSAYFNT